MPDLIQSLLKQDIGHLRIIAELWGFELQSNTLDQARDELSALLLDPSMVSEVMDNIPSDAKSGITSLIESHGRIPWAAFIRTHGDIRDAGAAKRDREKIYLTPSSTSEILFYRGILARAFFDTGKGPQEFAYIPDDLLNLLKYKQPSPFKMIEPLGRPASPGEKGLEIIANDHILDDATTLLAALRLGIDPPETKIPSNILYALLQSAKLIDKNGNPDPKPTKDFLEASRKDSLNMLIDSWTESDSFNELRLVPALICEGQWTNQPFETREFLLNLVHAIPENKWWSVNAFLRDIKQKFADFQRPAGDYDSWFIKRATDGQYMRGFDYWDQVDGTLVKFLIMNVMHWFGRVDLSSPEGSKEPSAFRIRSEPIISSEVGKVSVASNGKIIIQRTASRAARYQISRFCEWDDQKTNGYQYHISTNSLERAKEQGLKTDQLLALLVKYTDNMVPPSFANALKRWEINGTEVRVQTQVTLKVSKPEILDELRKSKAARFLGEVISPSVVAVKEGAVPKVMDALTELGLLTEVENDQTLDIAK